MKRSQLKRTPMNRGNGLRRSRMKVKPDREMAKWTLAVRTRDGNKCQWPGIGSDLRLALPEDVKISARLLVAPCASGDQRIDPHHISKRSQRPDLKYDPAIGICLCRTHHELTDRIPAVARMIGLLGTESYELARKRKAL